MVIYSITFIAPEVSPPANIPLVRLAQGAQFFLLAYKSPKSVVLLAEAKVTYSITFIAPEAVPPPTIALVLLPKAEALYLPTDISPKSLAFPVLDKFLWSI